MAELGGKLDRGSGLSVYGAARDAKDADAFVLPDGTVWTWGEVAGRVAAVVVRLGSRFGTEPASRVAFVAENRPATLLTFLALWEMGWAAVPLHMRWTDSERADYLDRLAVRHRLAPADLAVFESLPAVRAMPSRPDAAAHGTETIAALIATSGSTGGPKAVALSHRAFLASARASASRLGGEDGDRWLASLPFAHVGGLSVLTRCLEMRRPLVMTPTQESASAGLDPAETMAWAEEHRVTLLSLVPTMLRQLLDRSIAPPTSLRAVLLGGAAAPPSLVAEGLSAGWPLWLTYGLTEACSQVATGPAGGGSGAPLLAGIEARVVDEAVGGVLEIRGDVLFSGYEPDGTRRKPTDWFRTGDRARLQGDRIEILGRADDVIVTGGENVHPAEVEAALLEHPQVRAATVAGAPDERWGQIVAATVVADGVTEADLNAFLRTRLAAFRIPRRWRFVDELPTNATGKIDRRALSVALRKAGRPIKKKPASR